MTDAFVETMWSAASKAAANGGSFVPQADLAQLAAMTNQQVDALPYGAVRLDDSGRVSVYNRYESELGGIAQTAAIGKNFFTDIAPCTNNKVFRGCFQKALEMGTADALFSYTFTYRMKPTEVKVHLHRSGGANWVLITKK